jgi:ornithine carbamoyltransferase
MIEVGDGLRGRHFTRVNDWSHDELRDALDLADRLKAAQRAREPHALLPGRTLALIFEKPSARTRVSFAVGMAQLGGTFVELRGTDIGIGERESFRDVANTLSRYVDAIVLRTSAQERIDELARHASVPVINGLTDETHPCQALADLMTIRERFGRLSGVRLTYLGDGNNVCRSLMRGASKFGMRFTAATPRGHEPRQRALDETRQVAIQQGGTVELTHDPRAAAERAQVLYTDVWTSMGDEDGHARRVDELAGFGIDAELLSVASADAIVMHCLPAHYGEEITEDILYGPQSAVWDQAENRLHAQKAILALVVR